MAGDYKVKIKKRYILIACLGLVYFTDIFIASKINKNLLANDYYFEEQLAEVELNLEIFVNKNNPAKCKVFYKFGIYAYQTCFEPVDYNGDWNKNGYFFTYHKTKPKLKILAPANNTNSYYFKQSVYARKLYFIRRDGTITKMRPYL